MATEQTTNSKLDEQTGLLRWILTGVGGSIIAAAAWVGTQFVQDKGFLRDDVRNSLKELSTASASLAKSQEKSTEAQATYHATTAKTLEQQTKLLERISSSAEDVSRVQRMFPAVAEKMP